MTLNHKLSYLRAKLESDSKDLAKINEPESEDSNFAIVSSILTDIDALKKMQSNALHPALQAVFSKMLMNHVGFKILELPSLLEDEEIDQVSLDEFLKARGSDDFLFDEEETERQKLAYDKYIMLHQLVDQKMEEYLTVFDRISERTTCIRPLIHQEREFRIRALKKPFQHLKRKINYAFVEVPGSYISKRRKRGSLPKNSVRILKKWLFEHFSHPYPSVEEKEALSAQTGLKPSQVNYWFINARVRIWKPMIGKIFQFIMYI